MVQIIIQVPRSIACVSNTFPDKSFGGKAEVLSNIIYNGKHCQHFYTVFYVIIAIQKHSQTTDGISVVFPVITLRSSAITMDWLWKAGCTDISSYLVESCSQLTLQQGRWFFLPCCILHITRWHRDHWLSCLADKISGRTSPQRISAGSGVV